MAAIEELVGEPIEHQHVTQFLPEPRPAVSAWTAVVALIAFVLAIAMAVVSFRPDREPLPQRPDSVGAGGVAATAVAAYLAGSDTARRSFFGETEVRGDDFYVAGARTVLLSEEASTWRATVAVDLLSKTEGGYAPAGVHFYQITVAPTASGWKAGGPPALVPGPIVPADTVEWDRQIEPSVATYVETRLRGLLGPVVVLATAQRDDGHLVQVEATVGGHRQMLQYRVRERGGEREIVGLG